MLVTADEPGISTYRVEVSGWDRYQAFFVEKCELEWSEETGKRVTLARALRPGTMIFVRLLQPVSADQPFPVAYYAEQTGVTSDGQNQFRLSQVRPSTGEEKRSQR